MGQSLRLKEFELIQGKVILKIPYLQKLFWSLEEIPTLWQLYWVLTFLN